MKEIVEKFLLVIFATINLFAQPKFDFVVAKDSTGNFKTIQEAVNACRDYAERRYYIFVKKGIYFEKLVLPAWKTRITILGENAENTIIEYNDFSGKTDSAGNKMQEIK